MPHKKNPITAEKICGLARLLRGNAVAAMENVALWHERDISHSSVERVILPDSTIALHHMLVCLERLVGKMRVFPKRMQANLDMTRGLIHSQQLLIMLTKKGILRETAYELVQRNAMKTWQAKHAGGPQADFKAQLLGDPEVAKHLSREELDRLCTLDFHFKQVKARFKKVGL